MSDDIKGECVGGFLVIFDTRLYHFRKSQKNFRRFNGAESFVSQLFIEWKGVLDPPNRGLGLIARNQDMGTSQILYNSS